MNKDKTATDMLLTAFKLPYSETIEIPDFSKEKPFKSPGIVVELEPLNVETEIKVLHKVSEIARKVFETYEPGQENVERLSMSSIAMGIKDLLGGVCKFEWLLKLPDITEIILVHYNKNLTKKELKRIPLPKHLEIIYLQLETDRRSSDLATNFFLKIVRKIPVVDVTIKLITVIMQSAMSYQYSGSAVQSAESLDATPQPSPEDTAADK